MDNYSRLGWEMRREIMNYSKKICKGVGNPEWKQVSNMLYGIAESGSCHLSKIGRALREGITLKKTIDRLSRGLKDFSKEEQAQLQSNYGKAIKMK